MNDDFNLINPTKKKNEICFPKINFYLHFSCQIIPMHILRRDGKFWNLHRKSLTFFSHHVIRVVLWIVAVREKKLMEIDVPDPTTRQFIHYKWYFDWMWLQNRTEINRLCDGIMSIEYVDASTINHAMQIQSLKCEQTNY